MLGSYLVHSTPAKTDMAIRNEDELVDIALLLTQRQLDSRIIRSGLDLILAAGTCRSTRSSIGIVLMRKLSYQSARTSGPS